MVRMVSKLVSNDKHKVSSVWGAYFFEILRPTHFISKISFFYEKVCVYHLIPVLEPKLSSRGQKAEK